VQGCDGLTSTSVVAYAYKHAARADVIDSRLSINAARDGKFQTIIEECPNPPLQRSSDIKTYFLRGHG